MRSGMRVLAETPYLGRLALVVLLATMAAALVDYTFKAQVKASFDAGQQLGSFFSLYYAVVSLVTFAVQALASRAVLEKLGLEVEILDVCEDDCDHGSVFVAARVRNASEEIVPAGLPVTLYAIVDGAMIVADVRGTADAVAPGRTGPVVTFQVDATLAASASSFRARADDDGTGTGLLPECDEANNGARAGVGCFKIG